jgi:hypothetical protein
LPPFLDHLILGLVLDLGELDMLMMTPFSQVDVVAVHVDFLHVLEDLFTYMATMDSTSSSLEESSSSPSSPSSSLELP